MIEVNVIWSVRAPVIQQRYKCKELETWKQSGVIALKGIEGSEWDTAYLSGYQRVEVIEAPQPE